MVTFVVTFVFNLLLVAAFAALLRRMAARSDTGRASRRLIALLVALWFGIATASVLLAVSTTAAARQAIVLRVLGAKQPFAAIRNADPAMWAKLGEAVGKGLEDGKRKGMKASVERSVRAVVQPYMTEKLTHAPDASVVEMGGMMLASMRKASRESQRDCAALSRGDQAAMRRYVDEERTGRWLERIIRSEPVTDPRMDAPAAIQAAIARAMAVKGLQVEASGGDDAACRNAINVLETMLALPEADAAAALRSTGQGVTMVTR